MCAAYVDGRIAGHLSDAVGANGSGDLYCCRSILIHSVHTAAVSACCTQALGAL